MAKEKALDIFALFGELDRKNFDLWETWTEEQRKEFSPFMTLRWLAGTHEPEQLVKLGDIACACLFEFSDKKELMLKVLTACTASGPKRYKWMPPKGAAKSSSKMLELVAETYGMPQRHARDLMSLFSKDELTELGRAAGMQDDEVKEALKGA